MMKKVKVVVEKSTNEKYASKAAMMKHERTEGKIERMKEYGAGVKHTGKHKKC